MYLGAIVGLFAALVAYFALYTNHVWNRRSYAMHVIGLWNDKGAKHREAIERIIPGLIDPVNRASENHYRIRMLMQQEASDIYLTHPEDGPKWLLRVHLIELGNFFEFICMAYENKVADEKMIEAAFKNSLMRWHDIMHNFIEIMESERGYHPWPPFERVVKKWKQVSNSERKATGTISG